MQGAVGADSASSTANAEDTTLEAREWLKSEQLMSVGGFSEAFARLEALPKSINWRAGGGHCARRERHWLA